MCHHILKKNLASHRFHSILRIPDLYHMLVVYLKNTIFFNFDNTFEIIPIRPIIRRIHSSTRDFNKVSYFVYVELIWLSVWNLNLILTNFCLTKQNENNNRELHFELSSHCMQDLSSWFIAFTIGELFAKI